MDLHEEISKVAYELYEKSGRVKGRDLKNWLEAEKIVTARYKKQEKLEAKSSSSLKKENASSTKKKVKKI
jgi:hypothetical protein